MKKYITTFIVCCMLCSCIACSRNTENERESSTQGEEILEWKFSQNVERVVTEDGWVYSFCWSYFKDKDFEGSIVPFTFTGMNLRYVDIVDGKPRIRVLSGEGTEPINRDMAKIAEMLDYENGQVTVEDLKNLDPDSFEFEVLDKEMFLSMIDAVLNGEPHKEGNLYNLPSYGVITEPSYTNGCKIQIGFEVSMCMVDIMFIDVLYENAESSVGYIQLSDIIEAGNATQEQCRLYEILQTISEGVVKENNLSFGEETYRQEKIEELKLSRLYDFLRDIEMNDLSRYD